VPYVGFPYEQLPQPVKDNISAEQWPEVQPGVVPQGDLIPEKTAYVNL
jgi:hypothetical protein